MHHSNSRKICLIGNSFAKGGAENAHARLSVFLAKNGYEVFNILFDKREVDYSFAGELFEIGFTPKQSYLDKILHLNRLRNYLAQHKFDCIIDFRYRGTYYFEWLLVRGILSKYNYLPIVSSYHTSLYFTDNHWVAKNLYKKSPLIIGVSRAICEKIKSEYHYPNVATLYNSIDLGLIDQLKEEPIAISDKFIVHQGRMSLDNVKQQDQIILAYAKSKLPEQNVKLVLLGDGVGRLKILELIRELNLTEKVISLGFEQNPYKYLSKAQFMILASKYEGFPNSIIESYACQRPVISFDCLSGPNEIIGHLENGLLVKNQDFDQLTQAMDLLIEDHKLYQRLKSNCQQTAEKFSQDGIGAQWLKVIEHSITGRN